MGRGDASRSLRELPAVHELAAELDAPHALAVQAALGVTILSLGEVSAGKLAEIPGTKTFAHELFNQMHYGVTNNLAALALILLGLVASGAKRRTFWSADPAAILPSPATASDVGAPSKPTSVRRSLPVIGFQSLTLLSAPTTAT